MKPQSTSQGEEGLFLPLVAMMLFAIVAVIGLAVDGGRLYRSRLELQKAADAAVIAAAKQFAMMPHPGRIDQWKKGLMDDVILVLRANLEANHGTLPQREPDIQITPGDIDVRKETVRVKVKWDVPLYILGNFPGYSSTVAVDIATKAQVRKALVSTIVDTSLSMICPNTGNNCDCSTLTPPQCPDPKMRYVNRALKDFANLFNQNWDRLDVTWFSVAARTDFQMGDLLTGGGKGFDKQGIFRHFDDILIGPHVQGSTNTCDGLFRSFVGTFLPTKYEHRANVSRVLFTDGAPAAARFLFASPQAIAPNHLPWSPASPLYDYDFYQWGVNWKTHDQWQTGGPQNQGFDGVSDLALAEMPFSWSQGYLPKIFPDRFYPDLQGLRDVACSNQDKHDPRYIDAYRPCLNNFGFYVPDSDQVDAGQPLRVYGAGVDFSKYREQFYNCAIAMSDFLRRDGSTVYAVSIGANPPPDPRVPPDPYQDVLNYHSRKDCFLSRVAAESNPDNAICKTTDFPGEFGTGAAGLLYMTPRQRRTTVQNHSKEGRYKYALNATPVQGLLINEIYPRLARKAKTSLLIPFS